MKGNGRLSVAVLFGGTSTEHDVSVNSGLNVVDALDARRHRVTPVYLARGGSWHFGHCPEAPSLERGAASEAAASRRGPELPAPDDPYETFRSGEFDVAFVALHGPGGEDGKVQGLLDLAGVPYTGSGVLASALAMDKVRTKRLLAAQGVPVAQDLVLQRHRDAAASRSAERVAEIRERVGLPCVVKPVRGGSSFATAIVREIDRLGPAIDAALAEDEYALVESYLVGTELTCGVLGGGPHEPAVALPLTEIVPVSDEFFDFRAKYTVGACDEITPARVEDAVVERVQALSRLAHETIGCEGLSRSDYILTSSGPVMLEINTIPGMTRTSLFPQGAAAAGISFAELIERLLRSALLRAGITPGTSAGESA